MGGAARARDDHTKPAFSGGARVVLQILRRAMGGNDFRFTGDMKLGTNVGGGFHGWPVRIAAHEDADDGGHGFFGLHNDCSGLRRTGIDEQSGLGKAKSAGQATPCSGIRRLRR